MTRRVKSLVAAGLVAALSLGIGGSLVSTASADGSGLGKLGATSYKEADYISNASLEGLRDYMGFNVSQLSAELFKSIVDRAVLVEPLTDENSNYQQKWRITWNLSEAQRPRQWKGDGAVPYDSSGFDDMSNPDYSLMVSQDLTILTDSKHTPHWTVYNREEPNKAFTSFDLPLWKTQKGDVKTVTNQYGYSNTLRDMYYFGQYKDADGHGAPANWQDLTKACLAGDGKASEVSSQYYSPCGNYVEWLNSSGQSFAAGQSDLSDNSTRYVDGENYKRSLEQFNKFAQQIGGLQTFEWHTGSFNKSTGNLGQIVTVEFTTQRTPWAGNGNEKVHRTFVAGHYKGNYRSWLYQGTQFKYVEIPEKDSDGDGLTDRFELGIGSCPFPRDSAEYNETPNCKGVADPTDTDGDGVPDGKEVKSQTPKLTETGFKIKGTDPTVAPQPPSNPSDPTGHKGEKVTGKTRPYETVELVDLSTGALIASTIADENGNYTLEPGRILARTNSSNKYGNNIKFASEEDEAARKPVMMNGGTPVPDGKKHLVAVRIWSDGMDPLPGSEATRPQFDTPTGVLPNLKVDEKTPVQDPHHLTDDEKQKVKDNINKSIPGASDVVVNDDGSATVTIGGSPYTIPSQDLITTAPALVNIRVNYTWHNADNGDKPYSTVGQDILDRLKQYIPVTVIITKSDGTKIQVTKAPSSSSEGNYFGNNIGGFTSGDTISLSYSYELKNKIRCVVNYGEIDKEAGKSGGVDIPATKLYGTNEQRTPQKFDTALYDEVNKFTLNIDSSCHQGVIVYPMGNIPVKYTSVNSDGRFLLSDDDLMWKQYPMEDAEGGPRFDGQFPDGQPTQWERFHRAVEHPTLVKPYQNLEPDPNNVTTYDASNPMKYNATALTRGNTDTPVTMRKYTPLEPGDWKFSTDTMPLWKWRMRCPYFKSPKDKNGKPIGSSVQPGKTTVCFLDAATSEVSLLGDMPDYAKNAWVFTLQSDDGKNKDVNAGSAVDVTHTRNYYPGTLRVASTNVGKIASSQPKFYLYTGNDATQASLSDTTHWVELVKGEEVKTWPAYKKWASDIEPDVLYKVTGDHRVVESTQDYSPVPVTVDETQHIALKVAVTPITNSTLPSAGGMGTTWRIVGIIILIAAFFLAIVALLKKRAM